MRVGDLVKVNRHLYIANRVYYGQVGMVIEVFEGTDESMVVVVYGPDDTQIFHTSSLDIISRAGYNDEQQD